MDIPISTEAILTVAGCAAFGGLVTQWLKRYIARDLVVNALCLALCLTFALTAQVIRAGGLPSAEQAFSAALIGFGGASLATFGYETLANIAKLPRPPTP